jgi:hypothetical protein
MRRFLFAHQKALRADGDGRQLVHQVQSKNRMAGNERRLFHKNVLARASKHTHFVSGALL